MGKTVSKWKSTSMSTVHAKLNGKNIYGILLKKIAENYHSSTSEGDSSHISWNVKPAHFIVS